METYSKFIVPKITIIPLLFFTIFLFGREQQEKSHKETVQDQNTSVKGDWDEYW